MTHAHSASPQSTLASPVAARQQCINPACNQAYAVGRVLTGCPACGHLLDVRYDWAQVTPAESLRNKDFSHFLRPDSGAECSGVWQFRQLMPFFNSPADIVSVGEGKTILQRANAIAANLGFELGSLHLQYEGLNPTGSFKDNGMTAAFTHAKMVGAKTVACASTGNTSASMAMYARAAGMRAVVFIGEGKIAYGKLSQALDYGATTLQVAGDFDACLARVREIADDASTGVYLMNSVNPFRLEGQKAVMLRVLRDLGFGRGGTVPDWIVVPGGNLGNCSAFAKAFLELRELGMIDRVPRLAVINALGARTLDRIYNDLNVRWDGGNILDASRWQVVLDEYARMDAAGEHADTIASAIEINRPVNLSKSLRALEVMNGATRDGKWTDGQPGVVRSVDDQTILDYKAMIGRDGLGCEPASAASLAGAHMLLNEGVIEKGQTVACVLTGHLLKDPDATVKFHTGIDGKQAMQEYLAKHGEQSPTSDQANQPVRVANDLDAIRKALGV